MKRKKLNLMILPKRSRFSFAEQLNIGCSMKKLVFASAFMLIYIFFSHINFARSIYSLVHAGKNDSVKILVEKNLKLVMEKNSQNMTLLHWAAIAGKKELSIKYYEKSLELNPKNTNAVEQLNKLREK